MSAAAEDHSIADLAVIVCLSFDHRASAPGLKKFKTCIASCPFVETTAEVSGAYDMIVQGSCASLAEYNEHMDGIRPFIAEFVTRIETSFIGKVIESSNDDEESETLWLPCEDGHKQVQTHMVDKVEAEGDYMRVHVGDWKCLVHEHSTGCPNVWALPISSSFTAPRW